MTRSELIDIIHKQFPHLRQAEVEEVVSVFFNSITSALSDGRSVTLRGLGTFLVKHRDARIARNPKTGEWVKVGAKRTPFLRTGKKIHRLLNPDDS